MKLAFLDKNTIQMKSILYPIVDSGYELIVEHVVTP